MPSATALVSKTIESVQQRGSVQVDDRVLVIDHDRIGFADQIGALGQNDSIRPDRLCMLLGCVDALGCLDRIGILVANTELFQSIT